MSEYSKSTLQGQKALVTGGSAGIGKETVLALAASGADVAINYYRGEEEAKDICDQVEKMGQKALVVQADVGKKEDVDAMFKKVMDSFGSLDILVSNSGIQKDAPFLDMSLEDWNRVLAVNLTGQFLCAQAAAREFVRQGVIEGKSKAAGKIICMSSVHQVIPWAGHINYAAAKGGVKLMMETLGQELAPHKIRVNALAPGAIKTDINREVWENPEKEEELLKLIPYKRMGVTEDIAKAVVWLASDDSDYVTGTTLFVDGGMTNYPGFIGNG